MKCSKVFRFLRPIAIFGIVLIAIELIGLNSLQPITLLTKTINSIGGNSLHRKRYASHRSHSLDNYPRDVYPDLYKSSNDDEYNNNMLSKSMAHKHISRKKGYKKSGNIFKKKKTSNQANNTSLNDILLNRSSTREKSISLEDSNKLRLFKHVLSEDNRTMLLGMMDLIHEIAERENLTYFLCDGSVIGSYRHHGMVPWDDDIDVMVPKEQRVTFLKQFAGLKDPLVYKNNAYWFAKLYSPKSPHKHRGLTAHTSFTSPYVDVVFYDEDYDSIWHQKHPRMYKADIFPLKQRPFNHRMYFAPRDPLKYIINRGHDPNECVTSKLDHMAEKWRTLDKMASVPCRLLMNKFPFVKQTTGVDNTSCIESLVVGTHVLGTFVRSADSIPKC